MPAGLSHLKQMDRAAGDLKARALARFAAARDLPCLIAMSDPRRGADPLEAAERLPRGAALIYRAFGSPDASAIARSLAEVCRRRGLLLFIGADWRLARKVGARGVHLPERLAHRARSIRAAWPQGLITAAAHSRSALRRAARFGADAAILSPVFDSESASAGAPLGPVRFGAMARAATLPVYALGGVTEERARKLTCSDAFGLASVSALTPRT